MSDAPRENTPLVNIEQIAARESEQIEWKEGVADIDDVVETLSAFANDLANLGGGYVICGAKETKDANGFAKIEYTGLDANRFKEVENIVLTRCRERVSPSITPLVEELPANDPGKRVLVFIQPATGSAHTCRRKDEAGKYWVRVSRSTIEARNGVLRELMVRKGALETWDRRPCTAATVDDIDLIALRDALQRMRVFTAERGLEPYLSSDRELSPMVPSLFVREPLTNVLRPRNFTVLLFGREPQRFIPSAITVYSVYPGNDRSEIHAERHELTSTIISQAARLKELLDMQAYTTFDKSDSQTPNAVKYPSRALYEAMGNTLAHRDYEIVDPIRITVFSNRIELNSPGSLPYGVKADEFKEGKASPRWRNQTLAWFFNKLQLAQAEGQGIPTILRTMREEGCPPPEFDTSDVRVLCLLPAHPRHALLRDIREIEQAIALGKLEEAQRLCLAIMLRDPAHPRVLQLFAEVQTALGDADLVARVLSAKEIRLERIPAEVLLQLSDALSNRGQISEKHRDLGLRLLRTASNSRLEERELRRLITGLSRNGSAKEGLALIDRYIIEHPDFQENASLLQLKGDAMIGLAKRYRQTVRDPRLPAISRNRIWQQFWEALDQGEAHLRRADSLCVDPILADNIEKNLAFIDRFRKENQPKGARRRGSSRRRGRQDPS